ncbi:MAG: DMT family transporter, partial [Cellulomonas sp.]|nr:DMT family transporter [Cellulomonas sp.]
MTLVWGACFVVIGWGLPDAPVLWFAALRALLAGVALVALGGVQHRPLPPDSRSWALIAVFGLVDVTAGLGAMFAGAAGAAKGTAAVIEQLARDVTFYPARVVEFWALLIQSQHVNHVRAGNAQSVDIRAADRAAQVGTPFDPWAHTLEIRPIAGREGRYAIPNIGVSLWRLLAAPLGFAFDDPTDVQGGVTPRAVAAADGRFFLHPAGVDAPLFNRPRGEPEIAHLATEAELPAPLRRFPLRQELVARRAGTADPAGYFGLQPVLQIRLNGATLAPERLFIAHLGEQSGGGWRRPAAQGDVMIDPELGRLSLHPADAALPLEVAYAFGTPGQVGAGPWDRRSAFAAWLTAFAPPD